MRLVALEEAAMEVDIKEHDLLNIQMEYHDFKESLFRIEVDLNLMMGFFFYLGSDDAQFLFLAFVHVVDVLLCSRIIALLFIQNCRLCRFLDCWRIVLVFMLKMWSTLGGQVRQHENVQQ